MVRDLSGVTPDGSRRPLVVVSNREPYSHTRVDGEIEIERGAGGLTTALEPVMRDVGGTWVAWASGDADMEVADEDGVVAVPPGEHSYDLKRVELSETDVEKYYYGYSNRVLWPLCHEDTGRMEALPGFWSQYQSVNERFAEAALSVAEDEPIWFQDYHFAVAPRHVRERRPDADLLHFWHIPWPAPGVFRHCPHARDLLDGLLATDVLAFHTTEYADNFLACVDRLLPAATVDRDLGQVTYRDLTTTAVANPLGIDVEAMAADAHSADPRRVRERLLGSHQSDADVPIVVGVERLDYSKGVTERLVALEHLWETRPGLRGAFTYVQKATRTREGIETYRRYRESVEDRIETINRRFGTDGWRPVVYVEETLDDETLAGLYRAADVALVTPRRDGMNLVAHEFVVASIDDDGVLVLSELAGASAEFADGALVVNPHDVAALADTIATALDLPADERRERLVELRGRIRELDNGRWLDRQLAALDDA